MRFHHIIAAAAASLTATIGMAADAPQSFVHNGDTYVYQITETNGERVITGRDLSRRAPFRLVVRNGRVTGMSGNTPVSFRVREAAGASRVMAGADHGMVTASN